MFSQPMMITLRAVLAICLLGASGAHSLAQLPEPGSVSLNAGFIKLFGELTTFTAQVDAQVLDRSGREAARVPVTVQALDQSVRMDIHLPSVKSRDLPAFAVEAFKQAGLETIISLVLPRQQASYIIYPGVKSYVSAPLASASPDQLRSGYKVEKTSLGRETVQDRACEKHRVKVTGPSGVLEAITWNAADLKNFPIQIQTRDRDNTLVLRFSEIQFAKPLAARFEVPSAYTQYTNTQSLMFAIMKQIASGGVGPIGK
jgi:hypothetical protein